MLGARPPLAQQIMQADPGLGLRQASDPDPAQQAFFRSDHVAFLRRDIPSIFFNTWLHSDYHRPSDEVQRVDAEKAARIARFIFRLCDAVADAPAAPSWSPGGLDRVHEALKGLPF